ncbi:MAG TPA: DUF262 domain-containing protein [Brevundimonas sp.]|uniref:GmrSD restriction endonuclease domain-containing protein n=1 Tax=Brevundimonas sp. TaxID=1871086 RepID=UPI002616CCA1|nr:DUF262 domain-containing protein [Brevundimonas sp.]HRO33187.1 DUF262 domain-containing protein [Brevundimonas sp.]
MTVAPQGMSIQTVYRAYRDGVLLVNRQYQRKLVWTVAEKQRLIDSILRDYPLPLFLFAEKSPSSPDQPIRWEIIDGMQRLNAVFSFIEHNFKWDDKVFDLKELPRARQAAEAGLFTPYPDEVERLDAAQCANLLDYQLAVTVFPGESEARITDVFRRINSGGKQLSDQERRQAGVLSPFAELVRGLAAEIRGDVSRETLLLSEMPEISIETSRNPHGYALKAEDIFWCYQGVLRTGDLRDSDDEQLIADLIASLVGDVPAEATGEYLDAIYRQGTEAALTVDDNLRSYGRDRLAHEIKITFSAVRSVIEAVDTSRFAFRKLVYPKATSNAQKAPFFAVFMAFHELMHRENLQPGDPAKIFESLNNLTDRISVGMKHTKTADRQDNIRTAKGLIRDHFIAGDVAAFSHGPGLVFDFENSIRRARMENSRYEFKQGILRLEDGKKRDDTALQTIVETICGIANIGPDADGFIYIGIVDKPADAKRVLELYDVEAVNFDTAQIVGVDREAAQLGLPLDQYMRIVSDYVRNSALDDPLKTNVLAGMDLIAYKGRSVIRVRVPRQHAPSFLNGECYLRIGATTIKANGPQIAAIAKQFG